MSETIEKIKLYILSLWLLFALIIVLKVSIPVYIGPDWEFIGMKKMVSTNIIPIVCLILLLLGFFFYSTFDYKTDGAKKLPFKIKEVENANYEHLSFLATYIIPLICFNFDDIRYVIVLFLVLIIIGAIYVKTNIFYANPTLALLGFKIYKANKEDGSKITIISKDKLNNDDSIRTIKLDDKIFYARRV